jgi:hypothetical protein
LGFIFFFKRRSLIKIIDTVIHAVKKPSNATP